MTNVCPAPLQDLARITQASSFSLGMKKTAASSLFTYPRHPTFAFPRWDGRPKGRDGASPVTAVSVVPQPLASSCARSATNSDPPTEITRRWRLLLSGERTNDEFAGRLSCSSSLGKYLSRSWCQLKCHVSIKRLRVGADKSPLAEHNDPTLHLNPS